MHVRIKNPVDIFKAIGLNESVSLCMGTCDLPEMYAHSSQAVPSDFGHTFRQIILVHATTINIYGYSIILYIFVSVWLVRANNAIVL